jgi:hypothetical protein
MTYNLASERCGLYIFLDPAAGHIASNNYTVAQVLSATDSYRQDDFDATEWALE